MCGGRAAVAGEHATPTPRPADPDYRDHRRHPDDVPATSPRVTPKGLPGSIGPTPTFPAGSRAVTPPGRLEETSQGSRWRTASDPPARRSPCAPCPASPSPPLRHGGGRCRLLARRRGTATGGAATVVSVTDGDTIDVELAGGEESIRLLGIRRPDPPPPAGRSRRFGAGASAQTAALLPPGTEVRLVRGDVEARDRYGWLLAYRPTGPTTACSSTAPSRHRQLSPTTLDIAPNDAHAAEAGRLVQRARRGSGAVACVRGPDVPGSLAWGA